MTSIDEFNNLVRSYKEKKNNKKEINKKNNK